MASQITASTKKTTTRIDPLWVSLGYSGLIFALLVYEFAQTLQHTTRFTPTITLLILLLLIAPFFGLFISPYFLRQRIYALALIIISFGLAMGVTALSGGYASPLWPTMIIPLLSALLLMSGPSGICVAIAVWCGYGTFILIAPTELRLEAVTTWLLNTTAVGLFILILERSINAQSAMRRRVETRERALHDFLMVSNRLRITTQSQTILEEVAGAVQTAGDFDCVTISQVDWQHDTTRVMVAIGASGRRLTAVEKLTFSWHEFAPLLEHGKRIGSQAILSATLPFRTIRDETHLLLPLTSHLDEIQGVLTVSVEHHAHRTLQEALPLLELLANQAAAALDNATLYNTLGQRVQEATVELENSADELRRARDRAEVLYAIAQALSITLDERLVLERTLTLIAQFTRAEHGGIMLVEPHTGHLIFRTLLDRQHTEAARSLEQGQGLAGWVLANRTMAIVPDTLSDRRWKLFAGAPPLAHSVLAVPLLLEQEAMGVMLLTHTKTNHFSEEHAQIALTAAGQASIALSKAQLYRYVSEQSERLGATLQQREEEASKLLAVLRSIGDGVIVGDRLGRVRIINPAAEQILGITAGAFIGRALTELPGIDDNEANPNRLCKFSIGEHTVRAFFAPVMSSKDEWLGNVVVYHDITREEMTDKLKNELVATASHELRTPLTSVRGYVDMLMLDNFGTLNETQRNFLWIIKKNVTQLGQLVDELLDMSRVEAGEVRLRREELDMAELLYDTAQRLYGQFNERKVTLKLDFQDKLPRVHADRQRLQQVITNLLGNACKYTPSGGHVDVVLRNGGNVVRVDVHDTGVGITDEAKEHIFTPFYRAENPLRDEVGGTGLGLSITRKLVELHGGEIWFESIEGQGSTFSFTLPLVEA